MAVNKIGLERRVFLRLRRRQVRSSVTGRRCVGGILKGEVNSTQKGADNADDFELKNMEPRLVKMYTDKVFDSSPNVDCDDVAKLQIAKQCVMEAAVWHPCFARTFCPKMGGAVP